MYIGNNFRNLLGLGYQNRDTEYLLQRKNSVIKLWLSLLLLVFLALSCIFFVPYISLALSNTDLSIFWDCVLIITSISFFIVSVCAFIALCFGCKDKVVYRKFDEVLLVNGTPHKILNTNCYALIATWFVIISGLLDFRLENDAHVKVWFPFPIVPLDLFVKKLGFKDYLLSTILVSFVLGVTAILEYFFVQYFIFNQ